MTQRMIKWPSIEQFRSVIRNVQHKTRYKGKDENGEAIFDPFAKLPMLDFVGTVKLHGTNASVASSLNSINAESLWCQSRENIITPEKDNAGFAMFVESMKDDFADLLLTASLVNHTCADCYDDIVVYGEWCGKGIQSGVGISEIPKMFVIFGIAKVDAEGNKLYYTQREVTDVVDGCREYVKKPGEEAR